MRELSTGAISGTMGMKNYKVDWDSIMGALCMGGGMCVLMAYMSWDCFVNGKNDYATLIAWTCGFMALVCLAITVFVMWDSVERK